MIRIDKTLKHDKEEYIRPGNLYTKGDQMIIQGDVEFNAYGDVTINGVIMTGRQKMHFKEPVEVVLGKLSGIVFTNISQPEKTREIHVPVSDIPDYMDEQTRSFNMMMDNYLAQRGITRKEIEPEEDIEDGDMEEIPISTFSLVLDDSQEQVSEEIDSNVMEKIVDIPEPDQEKVEEIPELSEKTG